jgi:hypothetical protein
VVTNLLSYSKYNISYESTNFATSYPKPNKCAYQAYTGTERVSDLYHYQSN